MLETVRNYIENLDTSIATGRKKVLEELVDYIKSNDRPNLNFICTHNSRRSHLSQVWAQVLGHYYDVPIKTFSGGTEATAFNPNAVTALKRAGFSIVQGEGGNPRYSVSFAEDKEPLICFSKVYDHPANPQKDFAAVMTQVKPALSAE